jgi:Protein of unknown function (DUF3309)
MLAAISLLPRDRRFPMEVPESVLVSRTMGRIMLGTILVIILVLALLGAIPRWGYSRSWGYGPSGLVGVLLIVVLVLALSGHV